MATKIDTKRLAEILFSVKWKPFLGSGHEESFSGVYERVDEDGVGEEHNTMVGESDTHTVLLGPTSLGFYDDNDGYLEFNLEVACDGNLDEGDYDENQS